MYDYRAVFDGGCYGNGTENAIAYGSYKIYKLEALAVYDQFYLPSCTTNNQAEWESFRKLLLYLTKNEEYKGVNWRIECDSDIVRKQFTGEWLCRDEELRKIRIRCLALSKQIKGIELVHIPGKTVKTILGH
jgi:ribonuclease HI